MLIPNNKALKDKLAKDEYELVLTLSNTTLTNQSIQNSKILQDSFSVNRFSVTGGTIEVGSATAAEMQVTIDNSDGSFDAWTFEGATIFARLKATISGTAEYMDIGYFIVDEVVRQRDSIQLVCLDKMVWFDKAIVWSVEPNDGGFVFSTSPATLLSNICSACNVSYNSASFTANAVNQSVTLAAPTSENLTYRQLLQWLCQVIGVCAYINESGALTVAWYAQKTYSGDDAEDRAAQDIITPSNRFSSTIDRDPVTISNVSVKVGETTYAANSDNTYTLAIEGNELISEDNYASILSSLATRLVGFSYYPFTADVLGLQWLQPLDITTFVDKDDVEHTVIITDWTYSRGRNTQLAGKGESATRKGYASNPPFTAAQQRIIEEIKRNTPEVDIDDRIEAVFALNNAVNNGMMLHSTTVDGKVYYHNAATLADSDLIATANTGGFAWTTSGWNSGNPSWSYGISNDGAAVLQTLSTYSLNADLITAGTIDARYVDVKYLDADNITAGTIQDANRRNTIDLDTGNISLGNGNITYNASTGVFSIGSGAVETAVEDVLSNQLVEYAVSESGTTPPSDGSTSSITETWYVSYAQTNTADAIIETLSSQSAWNYSYREGYLHTCISLMNWNSTNKYLYSFDRTDYSDGTFDIDNVTLVATFGSGSNSTIIAEDQLHGVLAGGSSISISSLENSVIWESLRPNASQHITALDWKSGTILYSFKRTVYENGSYSASNLVTRAYGQGSSSTILEEHGWWLASGVDVATLASESDFIYTVIDGNWFNDSSGNHGQHYFTCEWNSTNKYLVTLKRKVFQDGSTACSDIVAKAVYGTSYPQFGDNPWSSTMPSIAENKGKYLWTRTTIGENEPTYAVNYIGNDGVDGQDGQDGQQGATGNGVSSIVTKYAATATTTAPSSSSDWKDSPSQAQISASKPYLWTKTTTTYTNGTSSTTDPTIIGHYGKDGSSGEGTQGRGISAITPQYALSTSNSTAPVAGWQDTIPEYPTTTAPTASGTLSSSLDSATTILTNLNLLAGTTYSIKIKLDKNGISGTRFDLKNASETAVAGFTFNGSSSDSYTHTPSVSGVYHMTFTPKQEHAYEVSVSGNDLSVKYYYWQRDKIEWDDGSADTYTEAILSTGFNAAIFNTNKLNPLFAEVYLEGATQVMFDAGHIYANSLTAYSVAAYEAFIRNLMANYVQVDGNVDVTNGDITVTQAETTSPQMTQTYLDSFCQTNYSGKNFSQLSPFIQPFAYMRAVTAYLYDQAQVAANNGKMVVETANGYKKAALYPNALIFADSTSGSSSYSSYGKDAIVGGNVQVKGNIAASNIQKGDLTVNLDSSGKSAEITVTFDQPFTYPPVVTLSVVYSLTGKILCAYLTRSSSTGFKAVVESANWGSTSGSTCVLNWIAIS